MRFSCSTIPTSKHTAMKQGLPTASRCSPAVKCAAMSNSGSNSPLNSSGSNGSSSSFTPISSPKLSPPETSSRRNGHSRPAAASATVILTQEQSAMTKKGKVLYDIVTEVAQSGGSTTPDAISLPPPSGVGSPGQVFVCPEESLFYSQAIEKLVLSRPDCPNNIIEFGAGDGSPVISALLKAAPSEDRVVNAYEIGTSAAKLATARAAQFGLSEQYVVRNSCFWQGLQETPCECLIANPPYLPAPDDDMLMPALWGGVDGAGVTCDLLSAGFSSAMLLISAYSHPVLTLQHAKEQGYAVTDFLCTPLPFGTYSSEPRVRQWIDSMKQRGEAFFSPSGVYILAAVLFEKPQQGSATKPDLTNELLKVLTAF